MNLDSTFKFLNQLKKNNNREWFTKHKDKYLQSQEDLIDFADTLLNEVKKKDNIATVSGKKSIYRIYRDVRFSKDKSPYKSNRSGSFVRATDFLRGGYYFHIQPGNSFIAGGFWSPSPQDIKHIREHIAMDDAPLRKILKSKSFQANFKEIKGDQLKTAPKGFEKDHPAIDLLRYKQLILMKDFSDKEVLSPNFHKEAAKGFFAMRPFLDYMSEILTTNLNGESIIK